MSFIIRLLINIIALFFVVNIVPGIQAAGWEALVVAAVIIGLLNSFLRPLLILLTLPITILSMGIFTLFINALMFYLAAKVVKGFTVESFWSAFLAALIFSIISFILNIIFSPTTSVRFGAYRSSPPPQKKNDDDVIDVEGKIVE